MLSDENGIWEEYYSNPHVAGLEVEGREGTSRCALVCINPAARRKTGASVDPLLWGLYIFLVTSASNSVPGPGIQANIDGVRHMKILTREIN